MNALLAKPIILACAAALTPAPHVLASHDHELHESLEPISFFLGSYEIDATWSFGSTLEAVTFFEPMLGGRFIQGDTYPSDNGGEPYHRYHAVMAYNPETHTITAYSFAFDGKASVTENKLEGSPGSAYYKTTWPDGSIRERFGQGPDGTLAWKVWMRDQSLGDNADPAWNLIMDDAWRPAPEAERPDVSAPKLQGKLAELAPFLGSWETDAATKPGGKFWARSVFRPGIGGHFMLAETYAKDEAGRVYKRYVSIFDWDEEAETFRAYGFIADGMVIVSDVTLDRDANGDPIRMHTTWEQKNGPQTFVFRQTVSVPEASADSYTWRTFYREHSASDWAEAMGGVWERVEAPKK